MIATVKIAPVERWCPQYRRHRTGTKAQTIQIDTASMTKVPPVEQLAGHEECNWWRVTAQCVAQFNEMGAKNDPGLDYYVCEHMLEMD